MTGERYRVAPYTVFAAIKATDKLDTRNARTVIKRDALIFPGTSRLDRRGVDLMLRLAPMLDRPKHGFYAFAQGGWAFLVPADGVKRFR